jgi:density-regulated protein DRP1
MELEAVNVIYCTKCGMPPEYCEYGPDYERVCEPYLKRKYPELYAKLMSLKGKDNSGDDAGEDGEQAAVIEKPSDPWTIEERLTKFYEEYVPEKVSDVPTLLEKYAGKEEKLFMALVKKYGPEPEDPYYASDYDSNDDDDEEGDLADNMDNLQVGTSAGSKKRRGIKAKKAVKSETRVLIQKLLRNKRKATTVIVGMDSVEGVKLKDVSKAFSKRFAGSSSVKDGPKGKEIIIQGDHMEDVAEMIVSKFKVEGSNVFLDFEGQFVPYK